MGTATPAPLPLTLREAIDRGLKANLGLLVSDSTSDIARGQRLQSLSALLPSVNGQVSQTEEQLSLKTIGFNFSFPGVSIPSMVGPFHYTDARAFASWSAFDYSARKNYRAAQESERAARLSAQDARDLVVQAVAAGYLDDHRGRLADRRHPLPGPDGAGALRSRLRSASAPERRRLSTFCGRKWS